VISARLATGHGLLLLAPVRGLATEVAPLTRSLDEFGPAAVGLGLSREEMQGLIDYFVVPDGEPVVPLTSNELNEVRGLSRFGEVRVPNPSFVEVLRWGVHRNVAVEPLDPSEEGSAELFAEHIGYVELVRRTVRERRAGKAPPTPATPDDFAVEWERRIASGRGSRSLARARDSHLAERARALASDHGRVAVVVDRERFGGVRGLLDAAPGTA
jgi:hypothetical protein